MALQTYSDARHSAARSFENQEDPRFAAEDRAEEIDTAASEFAGNARLFDELLGEMGQSEIFAAAAALDAGDDLEFARIFRDARDAYATKQIEERLEDQPWLSPAAAAEQLSRAYA